MGNICQKSKECHGQDSSDIFLEQIITENSFFNQKASLTEKNQSIDDKQTSLRRNGPTSETAMVGIFPKLTQKQLDVLQKYKKIKSRRNQGRLLNKKIQFPCFYLHQKNLWYEGEWSQGQPNGSGKLYLRSGIYFQGEFTKGFANTSYGIVIFPEGSYYVGEIFESKLQGKGVYYNADKKLTYKGGWKSDKPHGFGIQLFENGNKYEGQFYEGYKNGKGRFQWKNGLVYEGDFKFGEMWGFGKLTKGQAQFEGYFQKGKKCGKRVQMKTATGMYQGKLKNGLMQGQGVFIWNDQKRYEGEFKQGRLQGRGRLMLPSGKQVQGIWQKGFNKEILSMKKI